MYLSLYIPPPPIILEILFCQSSGVISFHATVNILLSQLTQVSQALITSSVVPYMPGDLYLGLSFYWFFLTSACSMCDSSTSF